MTFHEILDLIDERLSLYSSMVITSSSDIAHRDSSFNELMNIRNIIYKKEYEKLPEHIKEKGL